MRAAAALGATVRWTEHGAVLDTDLLLGDVLADREKKYLAFAGPDFTTAIERDTLARAAPVRRLFIDVAACVDADGASRPLARRSGRLQLEAEVRRAR